jgi:drug/metabolite transporter (DMT)-like permease
VLASVLAVPVLVGALGGVHVASAGFVLALARGTGTTALAYVAWYACQRSLSGTTAGAVQLVIPVLTAIGAALLLGEQLTARLGVCAALVVVGTWLGRPSGPAPGGIEARHGTSGASSDVETV